MPGAGFACAVRQSVYRDGWNVTDGERLAVERSSSVAGQARLPIRLIEIVVAAAGRGAFRRRIRALGVLRVLLAVVLVEIRLRIEVRATDAAVELVRVCHDQFSG